jgi:cytoskeletal protein CcmA (bactofilin family)
MSFFSSRRQGDNRPADHPPATTPQRELPAQTSSGFTQPVGFETVLGANTTLEGTLRSSANVRLDGTFTGTLEISGNVLVGETAKINADINAKNISIAGAVRGNVSGKKVQLLRTGRIWGDIQATALTTEEGAFIDGKITMISKETAAEPAPKPISSESPAVDNVPPAADAPPSAAPDAPSAVETPATMDTAASEKPSDTPEADAQPDATTDTQEST